MDALTSANLGARRNEDIALDLLKFVSVTAGVGRPAVPSTGFSGSATPKPEEHVSQLLSLYGRCLKAVAGQASEQEQGSGAPELPGTRSDLPGKLPERVSKWSELPGAAPELSDSGTELLRRAPDGWPSQQ
ncbi:MAG: hypothetical protein ABSE51_16985 [Terracidiphilus sp.]|jgi:hypothetical protein